MRSIYYTFHIGTIEAIAPIEYIVYTQSVSGNHGT